MYAVGIDVVLEGNPCGGHGVGVEQGILNRHGAVVEGMPNEGGRGGSIYVELQGEAVGSLGARAGVAAEVVDGAAVGKGTARDDGIAQHRGGGAVDTLGCFPSFLQHFFHFQGLNDESIDWLYRNARVVAFPTYDEGFGLPMIEAFERGTPVACSDRPVLREVGKDLADYFPLNDVEACLELMRKYAFNEDFYQERKENLKNYRRFTWKNTADRIRELFDAVTED